VEDRQSCLSSRASGKRWTGVIACPPPGYWAISMTVVSRKKRVEDRQSCLSPAFVRQKRTGVIACPPPGAAPFHDRRFTQE
ncbi:MAG TPA: hypothetical protein VF846_01360, partial [Thermoanaerobaculia bacterium]